MGNSPQLISICHIISEYSSNILFKVTFIKWINFKQSDVKYTVDLFT